MMNEERTTVGWREYNAIRFMRNFIAGFKDCIRDEDVFSLLDKLCDRVTFLRLFRKHFTFKERIMCRNSCRHGSFCYSDPVQEFVRDLWNISKIRQKTRAFLLDLIDHLQVQHQPDPDDWMWKRWKEVNETLQLSQPESDILFVSLCIQMGVLERIVSYRTDPIAMMQNLACYLHRSENELRQQLTGDSKLRRYESLDSDYDVSPHIYNYIIGTSEDAFVSRFYDLDRSEALPMEFYGELLEKHGQILQDLLRTGKPVNILFYGAPGTGKTSFARSLAAELSLSCYKIEQMDLNDDVRSRKIAVDDFRFAAVQMCDSRLTPGSGIIVVDEADSMLCGSFPFFPGNSNHDEKGKLNTVLDRIHTPTIWITNTPAEALDESNRRRFDYSVKFDPLNHHQRLNIWKNNVAKMSLQESVTGDMMEYFSKQYAVSAGGITQALRNVVNLRPAKDNVRKVIEQLLVPHCELMNVKPDSENKFLPAKDYSLDGLNIKGDIPIDMIVDAVRRFRSDSPDSCPDRPRMNMLLSGPPGTGKTEFVKYLGSVLNTRVIVRMGSDLLSKWVGGTEENIAAAFRQAERENAILFFDEIDGMLQSRETAHNQWEVTQVNELLHQMENFNGVMIGATNFRQRLDSAVMRRFTFKVGFDYLDNAGKRSFFERMFDTTLTMDEIVRLNAIENLAPGDFRTVRQSMYYLGASSNAMRLSRLEEESAAKQVASVTCDKPKKIGF